MMPNPAADDTAASQPWNLNTAWPYSTDAWNAAIIMGDGFDVASITFISLSLTVFMSRWFRS